MINKIFGIGLSKTGIFSLRKGVRILGFSTIKKPKDVDILKQYDFANDIFISRRFEFLDYIFSNSKFILTIRDIDSWIKSIEYHYRTRNGSLRRNPLERLENRFLVYGTTFFEKEKFIKAYYAHYEKVVNCFKNRENQLLIMNIINGDGYEKLCPFLGKEIIEREFPYRNISNYIE